MWQFVWSVCVKNEKTSYLSPNRKLLFLRFDRLESESNNYSVTFKHIFLECRNLFHQEMIPLMKGGEGGTWVNFLLGMCHWPLRTPTPLQSILWTIIDPILVTFEQICNFHDPNLVTFYLFIYIYIYIYIFLFILNEEHFTFHLQYKHSATFANCKYEELSYPKIKKMCDPILVTLLKMRPHYSHTSHENATPLASYKEAPPHPPSSTFIKLILVFFCGSLCWLSSFTMTAKFREQMPNNFFFAMIWNFRIPF